LETLKLEIGKYYRTSEGAKVLILAKAEGYDCFLGQAMNGWADDGCFLKYTPDGHCSKANDRWNKLVAEWKEPKRIHGFINIYRGGEAVGGLRDTKEEANERALKGRIACIEIDVLEGQGLDGSAQ